MIGRRCRLALLLLAAVALGATALPAGAQSVDADPGAQDALLAKSHFEQIAREYADQTTKLNQTDAKINAARQQITNGLAEVASLESQLRERASAAYRGTAAGFFQVLLNAQSFRDFGVRYMALQKQSLAEARIISQLRGRRADLIGEEKQLSDEKAVELEEASTLQEQGRALTISFAQAQDVLAGLEGKLTPDEIAQLFRMSGPAGAGLRIPLDACPVKGLHFVNNDFGAPRDGGTRKHQGNDIMAAMGTPIVAPLSGTITLLQYGGNGGLATFEKAVGGVEFYFAHEQEIGVTQGQDVKSGDVIGFVGNTGNAAGGAPHLHFEIHPAGGPAIDPYPSLSAVC
jgi:murein DD-endopeptidase MepM/ murein hydrolase activator NlpD